MVYQQMSKTDTRKMNFKFLTSIAKTLLVLNF